MPEADNAKRSAKRPRAGRGEKKRFFLDCARHLFAEFGYAAVSFDQIADCAGVTRAAVLKLFPDKSAFLKAIGEEWLDVLFPAITGVEQSPIDVVNQLLEFSNRFLASLRSDQLTTRIILTGLVERIEEEESTILHVILESVVERLLPIIARSQQSGVLRRDIDPRQTACDWIRFSLGAALLPFPEPKEGDVPTLMIETLLHGVLKTDV